MYRLRTAYYRLVARLTNVRILAHFTGFGLYDRSVMDKIRADFRDPYPYFRGMIAELGLPVTHIDDPSHACLFPVLASVRAPLAVLTDAKTSGVSSYRR